MEAMELYRSTHRVGFKYSQGNIGIYPKCFHDHYEIYLLMEGEVEYIGEALKSKLKRGDLILIPPGIYHQFRVDASKPYCRCVLELQPSFAQEYSLPKTQRICSVSPTEDIYLAFQRIRMYAQKGLEEAVFGKLLEAIASEIVLLSCVMDTAARQDTRPADDIAVRSMEFLRTNLKNNIRLSDVADACHCSVSAVCHRFHLSYGISIMQYIRSKKMILARQALREGIPAAEVAMSLGFRNYSVFYRTFVKEFGRSPKDFEYRAK